MTPDRSEEVRDLMDRLDRVLPPHTHVVYEDGDDPLVEVARQLAEAPLPVLSEDAVRRIEARVQAHLAETLPPASSETPVHQRSLLRALRLAVAACLVIFILGVVGAGRASASSLPGDTLYPVKRAIESGRLALVTASDEANLRVELAVRRVDEFRRLLDRGDIYPRALEESSGQLWAAVRLLDAGEGDRERLGPRIDGVAQQQAALAAQALPAASAAAQTRLQTVAGDSVVLHDLFGGDPETLIEQAETEEPASAAPMPSLTLAVTATATMTATVMPTATPTPRGVTPTRRPPSSSIVPEPAATRLPTPVPQPHRFPTLTPAGQQGDGPGNSENAPGQQGGAPGNSENAPGQQGDGPGNSENAPGQQGDGPGNSENAPGQPGGAPGNSENAPGQQEDGPGNSENAPGQDKADKTS